MNKQTEGCCEKCVCMWKHCLIHDKEGDHCENDSCSCHKEEKQTTKLRCEGCKTWPCICDIHKKESDSTSIESIVSEFDEKQSKYDKDGGFIVFVEGYDNRDFDIDIIKNWLRTCLIQFQTTLIEKLAVEVEGLKLDFGTNDHEAGKWHTKGYNEACGDTLSILNKYK